jgi:hypothetical protein
MSRTEIEKLKKELDFFTVFSFFEKYGLNFVNSEAFRIATYLKANDDTKFWLTNAPHNLRGNHHGS